MPARIDKYDMLVARRQADIESLRRAIDLINQHSNLPPGSDYAVHVLDRELRRRVTSLRRMIETREL